MNKQITVTLTLPNGKRKYFRGNTRKEAEAKRDAAKAQMLSGIDIGDNTSVEQLAKLWLETYKKDSVRTVTYDNISNITRRYILPRLGQMRVKDVKPVHIRHMLSQLSDKSKGTQREVIQFTRAMFSAAVENDLIAKNPCTDKIKPAGSEPDEVIPLTRAQSAELLAKAEEGKLYLFTLLALNAGLRRSELLGLMWTDIDLDAGLLTVNRNVVASTSNPKGVLSNDLKTEAAHRTIPLPWSVVRELREYRHWSSSLFVVSDKDGSYMSVPNFQYHWEKLRDSVDFSVHPHQLRHTCITRWFERGLDMKEVQHLAGHSTITMTLAVYTHYQEEERHEETAQKIHAM